jgi:hypothetical protein
MKEETKKKDDEESEYVTVIIWKNNEQLSNGFGCSFNIMVPSGYGLGIFRRLVYSGCKAIGHKEFLSLRLECG